MAKNEVVRVMQALFIHHISQDGSQRGALRRVLKAISAFMVMRDFTVLGFGSLPTFLERGMASGIQRRGKSL